MRKVVLLLFALSLMLGSCKHQTIYNDFYEMPIDGWHQDSVLYYTINAQDSVPYYDMLIVLRHTAQYPYQNLWLFVDEYAGDMLVHQDTIEAMLADDYGRWLGAGFNRYELSLLYDEHHCFVPSGEHTFCIRQGMRTEWLQGITEVGLIVRD